MERKKVIFSLIQALSPEERQIFRKKIPGGGNDKTYTRLLAIFDFFEKLAAADNPSETVHGLDLTKIVKVGSYKKLYPYYDELIEGLKNFLVLKEIDDQPLEKEVLLQNALIKRVENTYLEELHSEIRQHILDTPEPLPEEYYRQSFFYFNLYSHLSTDTYKSEALLYLYQSQTSLDISYWTQKLRILVGIANRAIVFSNEEFLLKELPELPDLKIYTDQTNVNLLSIYTCIYPFIRKPLQSENLDIIINLIAKASNIQKEDQELILNYLNNLVTYYITRKNSINSNLSFKDTYSINKLGFSSLWFVQKDRTIPFEDFINILYLAFYNKDANFLKSIYVDYQEYILADCAPFIEMLSNGFYLFLNQKWEDAFKSLSNQSSPPKPYKLHYTVQRNVLEIKTLFESLLQDKTELEDISNALEKYFRFTQREFNISDIGKDRNLHFIKLLKKIYLYLNKRIDFQFDKKAAEKEVMDWVQAVEASEGKTIEIAWLRSIGERLLAEVQKTTTKRP